ncbi:unnamed protein product [Peniophora sp. CBMAI 1063]|nr:unnamed protein product [Peniophora sp. CBMAI 1063]
MASAAAMPPAQRSIDDEDESVRIAVRALGDMRSRALASQAQSVPSSSISPTPALSVTSGSVMTSPGLPSPATLAPEDLAAAGLTEQDINTADLVSRLGHLPIVNTALRAYEQSKASSRVVKYGAEMMESSVRTISRPVINRLPVDQLDEFARRQLDRFGYGSPNGAGGRRPSFMAEEERGRGEDRAEGSSTGWQGTRDVSMRRNSVERGEGSALADSPTSDSRHPDRVASPMVEERTTSPERQQQVVQRSRWQAIVSEAGGISAAVSEESMRRLKYCLQWLQYATEHIDGQILLIREFMDALQPPADSPYAINPHAVITPEQMQQLANVKRDVVDTIRQVVDVVSKYAGGALPEPARNRVRGFILHLPSAWASAARRQEHVQPPVPVVASGSATAARGRGQRRSARRAEPISRPGSPTGLTSRGHSRQSSGAAPIAAAGTTPGGAQAAAQRILTLATESLDMMRGVTGVVKDSLDRADAWVERLRVVGIQRGQEQIEDEGTNGRPPPLGLDLSAHRIPVGAGGHSAATSVANSPTISSAALSPLLHPHPHADHYFEGPSSFSNLSLSGTTAAGGSGTVTPTTTVGLGKKGLFVDGDAPPLSAPPSRRGSAGHSETPVAVMDVDRP